MDEPQFLSDADRKALVEVDRENVTWRSRGDGRISVRLWADEWHYSTGVTPQFRRLRQAGLVTFATGAMHGRGGVELTAAGRKALNP